LLTLSHFFLAAIAQGLFLIVLLIFNRNSKQHSNRLLACLVGLLSISLWNLNTPALGLAGHWKLFDYYLWGTPFLWGPILYLYVKSVTHQAVTGARAILPHLAIALTLLLLQFPYHFTAENEWISSSFLILFRRTVLFAFYIQMALYILASLIALNDYKRKLEDKFSNLDRINLAWLTRLLFILAALIAIDMITTVPGVILQTDLPFFNAIMIAESATIYLLGYFSLTHHEVIFQKEPVIEPTKYQSSPLDGDLSGDLSRDLNAVMHDSKIFRKNDLRLADLAELIGLKSHYLSQIINEQYQVSFYEYVNSFRVEFAAALLTENPTRSIADIAAESGFNNRASFNNYFKKQMGLTPSKYRQQYRSSQSNSLNISA